MVKKKRGKKALSAGTKGGSATLRNVSIILVASIILSAVFFLRGGEVPVWGFEVVNEYAHDRSSYTQGLVYEDGFLYESTGQYGTSKLRRVHLESGAVYREFRLDRAYFAEGLTLWDGKLLQLTWREEKCIIYGLDRFEILGEYRYKGEGWGLTNDSESLIMSNGTDTLTFRDPSNFRVTRRLKVNNDGQPVSQLNELEYIEGEIWANVYQSNLIARISPTSGDVLAWVDLTGLLPENRRYGGEEVLNGIAYDRVNRRIFVTGKKWGSLFEIKLIETAR